MPKKMTVSPSNHLTVKEWNSEDQPREKLMLHGAQSLSNSELLAILLRTGLKGENVLALSQRILSTVNNDLARLGSLSVEQILRDFKGIGPAKAVTVVAALELGRRRKEEAQKERTPMTDSRSLYQLFEPHLGYLDHEEMWAVFLNQALLPIETRRLSSGGIASTTFDLKQMLRMALERSAVAIALAHNHPSGHLKPSKEDINLTMRTKDACKILEIKLIDHIIVGQGKYYSFYDESNL